MGEGQQSLYHQGHCCWMKWGKAPSPHGEAVDRVLCPKCYKIIRDLLTLGEERHLSPAHDSPQTAGRVWVPPGRGARMLRKFHSQGPGTQVLPTLSWAGLPTTSLGSSEEQATAVWHRERAKAWRGFPMWRTHIGMAENRRWSTNIETKPKRNLKFMVRGGSHSNNKAQVQLNSWLDWLNRQCSWPNRKGGMPISKHKFYFPQSLLLYTICLAFSSNNNI